MPWSCVDVGRCDQAVFHDCARYEARFNDFDTSVGSVDLDVGDPPYRSQVAAKAKAWREARDQLLIANPTTVAGAAALARAAALTLEKWGDSDAKVMQLAAQAAAHLDRLVREQQSASPSSTESAGGGGLAWLARLKWRGSADAAARSQ